MSINEIQDEIVEQFALFDDWFDKYEFLIEMGKNLDPITDEYKIDEFAVKGCQSKVWIVAIKNNDTLTFQGDSDTLITKGILALLIKVFNNHKPADIASANLFMPEKIGLSKNLSPSRANGLGSMIQHMKFLAKSFS